MWWERWPERFDQELACLRGHGLSPVDQSTPDLKQAGYRSVAVQYRMPEGELLPITLEFPPEYPFFMAIAYLDPRDMLLARHQNPTNGELCLLNAGQSWAPSNKIGDVLIQMLPKILRIHNEPHGDYARQQEVSQGEPITGYFSKDNRSLLLIDDLEVPDHFEEGQLEAKALNSVGSAPRYALVKIMDKTSGGMVKASHKLCQRLREHPVVTGYWKRINFGVEELSQLNDATALIEQIHAPTLNRFRNRHLRAKALLLGLLKEEVEQGVYRDTWLGAELRPASGRGAKEKKGTRSKAGTYEWLFSAPYGSVVRWARSPQLRGLADKHVCLVGAGMLGSQVALQLARAGVGKLSIVDHDYLELATIVRYGLGAQYAGWKKVEALSDYFDRNYPLTETAPIPYRLGAPAPAEQHKASRMFHDVIESADLVIDAAAEKNVSYYLNDRLKCSNIPWIAVTTRPGSWGGDAWIIAPGGPCWSCFEHHNCGDSLPMPNGDDNESLLQVGGCTQLTNTGYGFDSDIFAINAVRAAVGILTPDATGYPKPEWNALVMNVRDKTGGYIAPTFEPFNLLHHPECDCQADVS